MKKIPYTLSTILLAVSSITLLIIGVSEKIYLLAIAGLLLFIVMIILRNRGIKDLNKDIENMNGEIQHEVDDTEV